MENDTTFQEFSGEREEDSEKMKNPWQVRKKVKKVNREVGIKVFTWFSDT